jgi:hypothetical protein
MVISGIIATIITKAIEYLFNQRFHFGVNFGISTPIVFSVIYFIFSKWLWKIRIFGEIFKFPNLNGEYEIEGSCEIMFTEDILSGSAKYYNNGKERPSYGTMKLRRSANA